ncbi:hypothetical protein P3X46_001607 [Hevea brasiliensis]|uniref:PGG domain-containing protein n=2 Tax=Hevea brasiliensis TaxID=3981 RepID=A0ABQ9NCZ6_HEVBR|nr:hypothetical protein P3X46_001607 [Hevea brasiliensis]
MISGFGEIALQVAISKDRSSLRFIRMLVQFMTSESLEAQNINGETSLHYAAIAGNIQAIRILVTKNPSLLNKGNFYGLTPLHYAAQYGHREAVSYLLSVTDQSRFTNKNFVRLVNLLITIDFYDKALDLLLWRPNLATEKDDEGTTALETLAQKRQAFPSGSNLGFCERLLYRFASVQLAGVPRGGDLKSAVDISEYQKESKKLGFLHNIYNTKLKHIQAQELLEFLIGKALKGGRLEIRELLRKPLLISARLGIYELVFEIVNAYPESVWFVDNEGRNVFHLAIIHRQKFIFRLFNRLSSHTMHLVNTSTETHMENLLHLAAKLGPLDEIPGVALQMHTEMLWFKEIEKVVQPSFREMKDGKGRTPRMVFTEEHKNLVERGEKWMRDTASSYSLVAVLVVTVAFAATFTVPGGNSEDHGIPIFLNETSFMIFTASNALALFSATTSLLMFLGILSSRYAENEFLKALPRRLCIGLITLFFSIASMLAAFSSALYIVVFHRVRWFAAPIAVLASAPATLFLFLQLPLLVEMVSYTIFQPSIIRQQTEEIIF